MKLPSIVKRIGEGEGESRVYIEDYVYSYLNELKNRKEMLPLKAALFGYTCSKDEKFFYFVYGAACITDELQKGRNEEDVRNLFFPTNEFIGYVNIYSEGLKLSEKKSDCCIFYDTNEPMQNYLLSCYNRNVEEGISLKEKEELKAVWKATEKKHYLWPGKWIKGLLILLLTLLFATTATTIDEYGEIRGLVEVAERTVLISEKYRE